jgi:hypothetical protein
VLFCRVAADSVDPAAEYDDVPARRRIREFGPLADACRGMRIHFVGARPTKAIDPLLTGRVLVIGDDADLNAVVLRLLRRQLLTTVEVAYAPPGPTPMTELYALRTGAGAVADARSGSARPAPLVRSDAGGVLVGRAEIAPVTGTFYVDARRVPAGRPALVRVRPESDQGLVVTASRRRPWALGHRVDAYSGRAVEFGIAAGTGTTITFDGIRHPREVNRWVFYRHTEPLLLVRPVHR